MQPDIYIAVLSILNVLVILLLTILGFIGKRLINTNDTQYELMHDIREFMHRIDKRVVILETHQKFTDIKTTKNDYKITGKKVKK